MIFLSYSSVSSRVQTNCLFRNPCWMLSVVLLVFYTMKINLTFVETTHILCYLFIFSFLPLLLHWMNKINNNKPCLFALDYRMNTAEGECSPFVSLSNDAPLLHRITSKNQKPLNVIAFQNTKLTIVCVLIWISISQITHASNQLWHNQALCFSLTLVVNIMSIDENSQMIRNCNKKKFVGVWQERYGFVLKRSTMSLFYLWEIVSVW